MSTSVIRLTYDVAIQTDIGCDQYSPSRKISSSLGNLSREAYGSALFCWKQSRPLFGEHNKLRIAVRIRVEESSFYTWNSRARLLAIHSEVKYSLTVLVIKVVPAGTISFQEG